MVAEVLNPFIWSMYDLAYPPPDSLFCFAIQPDCPDSQVPNSFWYIWFAQKFLIFFSIVATFKMLGKKK